VTEYLDAIAQAEELAKERAKDPSYEQKEEAPRKKISLTDPTARWTAAVGGRARFYMVNELSARHRNIRYCRC